MPRKYDPDFENRPLSRRSVLEWMGKATVLALGAGLAAACSRRPGPAPEDALSEGDTGGDPAGDAPGDAPGDASLPFEPGGDGMGIYDHWNVRSVDPQDLADILAGWKLRVDGMVETPRTYTFAELLGLARQDQVTDFHCVEGWSVLDVPWNGIHVSTLLAAAGPAAGSTHITFHTVKGEYNESLPIAVATEPRTMLGYGVGGSTLPLAHGFPLRVVAPRLYGYKNAKHVERMEITDHAVEGYWVAAGYPYDGEVTPSRLRPGKY